MTPALQLPKQRKTAHLEVPQVHSGPLAHVQEVLDITLIHNDVHSHLPPEASIQQVLEDVHVSEHVHDHSYHLRTGRHW